MPANMPIMCMVDGCGITCKGDSAYLQHMQTVHGTTSPDQAIGKQKAIQNNIPKDTPTVILDKDVPPSDDFMKLAQMMDQALQPPFGATSANQSLNRPPTPNILPSVPSRPIEEKKPITLKYKYEGNCEKCNIPVRTIMLKVDGRLFATAYCFTHEQLKEQEVEPLEEEMRRRTKTMTPDELNDMYKNMDASEAQELMKPDPIEERILARRKEASKRNGKRKSQFLREAPVQTTVSNSGMSKGNRKSI